MVTGGFFPAPSASTTSSGTTRPVAVFPPSRTVVENFMASSLASSPGAPQDRRSRELLSRPGACRPSWAAGTPAGLWLAFFVGREPPRRLAVGDLNHAERGELAPVAGALHAAERQLGRGAG